MEEDEDRPPFWQPNNQRRRRSSSFFLNSGVLVVLAVFMTATFIFILGPSILSLKYQYLRPNSVKKSWDSLNLVLVLFAIICAFLSKNNSNEEQAVVNESNEVQKMSNPSTPQKWYQFSDGSSYPAINGLKSGSSYPDLRQESMASEDQWRFYDDTHMNDYRDVGSDQVSLHRPLQPEVKYEVELEKPRSIPVVVDEVLSSPSEDRWQFYDDIHLNDYRDVGSDQLNAHPNMQSEVADVVENHVDEVPYAPSPENAAPPSPPKAGEAIQDVEEPVLRSESPSKRVTARRNMNRPHEAVARKKSHIKPEESSGPPAPIGRPKRKTKRSELKKRKTPVEYVEFNELEVKDLDQSQTPQPTMTLPPLPEMEQSSGKSGKKTGGANATKDFFATLYNQSQRRRKKKQRQKSIENLDSFLDIQPPSIPSYPPPSPVPPPPPLPPPPSAFYNLFKLGKTKKPQSELTAARIRTQIVPAHQYTSNLTAGMRNLPMRINSFDEASTSGGESPLNQIPPPPPLPPFKMSGWTFERQGDYVNIRSAKHSRSSSPESYEPESLPVKESTKSSENEDGDVDTEADSFIARFRAGLRLEKMDSMNQKKERARSNLGPGPVPGPT